MLDYLYGFLNKNPDNIFFYQYLGMAYYSMGERTQAERYLTEAWDINMDKEHTFRALLTLYAEARRPADMYRVAKDYIQYHEDDAIANEVIRNAQMLMQGQGQQPTPASTPPIQIQPQPQTPPPSSEDDGG